MDEELKGAFIDSLKRNNRQIRDDRAISIAEDAQLVYKREIEDLEMGIKRMKRDQENMLDLSPTNAQSLVLASDFKAAEYVNKDVDLSFEIWKTEAKLKLAKERYAYLFGGE